MVPFDNISTRATDHRDPNRFSDKINKKVWFYESVRLVTVTLYMTSGLSVSNKVYKTSCKHTQ